MYCDASIPPRSWSQLAQSEEYSSDFLMAIELKGVHVRPVNDRWLFRKELAKLAAGALIDLHVREVFGGQHEARKIAEGEERMK